MKYWILFLIIFTFIYQTVKCQDQELGTVLLPQEIYFINYPVEGDIRKNEYNIFEVFSEKKWQALPMEGFHERKDLTSLRAEFILGTPAVILKEIKIDASKVNENGNYPTKGVANHNGLQAVVVNKRKSIDGEIVSFFSVYNAKNKLDLIGTFRLNENPYNLILGGTYFLNERYLVITLWSSRHCYINSLIFFDMITKKAIGYNEFSVMQYFPKKQVFWLAAPIPNSINIEEVFKFNRKHAKFIPIFENNILSREFSNPTMITNELLNNKRR
jgi:hypothetical protein